MHSCAPRVSAASSRGTHPPVRPPVRLQALVAAQASVTPMASLLDGAAPSAVLFAPTNAAFDALAAALGVTTAQFISQSFYAFEVGGCKEAPRYPPHTHIHRIRVPTRRCAG